MHKIEQALESLLENIEHAEVPEAIIQEFGERCKDAIRQCLLAKRGEEPFKLRMSNIGKPLRQLILEKLYGREPVNPQFRLKMTYGYLIEALVLFLLKAAKLDIETDKFVKLNVKMGDETVVIPGKLDLKVEGKIYDVKSASPYSFDNKFTTFTELEADDPFGYCGQGFGYSIADKSMFGGWIVFDKSDGRLKVVPVPEDNYRDLAIKYLLDFKNKIFTLAQPKDKLEEVIPPCTGVIKETFNKKETGNEYLSKSCEFCACKYKCHPTLTFAEVPVSKAKKKTWRYYVKLLKPSIEDDGSN